MSSRLLAMRAAAPCSFRRRHLELLLRYQCSEYDRVASKIGLTDAQRRHAHVPVFSEECNHSVRGSTLLVRTQKGAPLPECLIAIRSGDR